LLVEQITFTARSSELVDQTSGVSARMPISALELLHSNLERRALKTGDAQVFPRLCDLHMLLPAVTGKVEMVYEGEQQGAEMVARKIIGEAVKAIFQERFPKIDRATGSGSEDDDGPYSEIVSWFADGGTLTISDEQPFADFLAQLTQVPGLMALAEKHAEGPSEVAISFAAEMILEGLHQNLKLGREDLDSTVSYKEMVKFQLLRPRRGRRDDGGGVN
ncbi:MAG: magnesium chelatase, partial [Acidobacteriota bacterium]